MLNANLFPNQKFPLGQIVSSDMALDACPLPETMWTLLRRHATGDWGDVCAEDAKLNDQSVNNGTRLLSSYKVGVQTVWILTEADRSVSTFLLPEEY